MKQRRRSSFLAGTTTLNQTRYHNAVNEITDVVTPPGYVDPVYDAAGNTTVMPKEGSPVDGNLTLKYDAWNRLVQVSIGGVLFLQQSEYDGLGQRIQRQPQLGTATDFYYNDQWQLLTEAVGSTVLAIYSWHPFYIDALATRMRSSDTHFFLHDANYNVTAAVDDSTDSVVERYDYTPYGEVTFLNPSFGQIGASTIGNTHLYTGRERDAETGLQLNRRRYYASHLGRWLTRDPIGYWGGTNLYGFIGGKPTYRVDPSGLLDDAGWGWPSWHDYCAYLNPWSGNESIDPILGIPGDVIQGGAIIGGGAAAGGACVCLAAGVGGGTPTLGAIGAAALKGCRPPKPPKSHRLWKPHVCRPGEAPPPWDDIIIGH